MGLLRAGTCAATQPVLHAYLIVQCSAAEDICCRTVAKPLLQGCLPKAVASLLVNLSSDVVTVKQYFPLALGLFLLIGTC